MAPEARPVTERAYCRVYYSIKDDTKFDTIREDDHHLATWLRLLMVADALWPASPDLPASARRTSVKALVDAELIDLLPGRRYRIRGLDAERGAERESAPASLSHTERITTVLRTHPGPDTRTRNRAKPSQAETEPRPSQRPRDPATASSLSPQSSPESSYRDHPRPTSASRRTRRGCSSSCPDTSPSDPSQGSDTEILGLIERRGAEEVLRQAGVMARGDKLSDRQWVFGLEDALEAVPSGKEAHAADRAEDERRAHARRLEATRERTAAEREFLASKEGTR